MPENQGKKNKVTIHNKILNSYTIYHVDGAFGGVTPQGLINLSLFAERVPIPKSSDFEILDDGKVGKLIQNSTDSKKGILREYQAGIYMDLAVAKSLVTLLNLKIKDLETVIQQEQEKQITKNK